MNRRREGEAAEAAPVGEDPEAGGPTASAAASEAPRTPLPRRRPADLTGAAGTEVPLEIRKRAAEIVDRVEREGEPAVRRLAELHDGLAPGAPLYRRREELEAALDALAAEDRARLERVAERIARFATAQREALTEIELPVPGGRAGHTVTPVATAGCYAPGGRYPLPSSVLMTVIPAKAAGVEVVWVASPKPPPIVLAAAAVAGADGLLTVGGAQAVAALAFGCGPVPACDLIAGPGNLWVTAAKQLVSRRTAIDLPAGPSELVVIADASADPALVAADLLAQAEHDEAAVPVLLAIGEEVLEAVEAELARQLPRLVTREVASAALATGAAVICATHEEACELSDRLAPEHLQLATAEPRADLARLRDYGSVFVGEAAGEVLGDYGAGPNHVLPTGGWARRRGGLSVLDFLRVTTWLEIDDSRAARELAEDAVWLARLEGLDGHRRAALRRLP